MDDFESIRKHGQDLRRGFSGLELFWEFFEETSLLSEREADFLDRIIERARGFTDGYNAALEKIKEAEK